MSDDGSYVFEVPDRCDRIIWRGRYYGLPYPTHADALDQINALRRDRDGLLGLIRFSLAPYVHVDMIEAMLRDALGEE